MTIRNIARAVSEAYGIPETMLMGHDQRRPIVRARWVVMAMARKLLNYSYPRIGMAMKRDHSTVAHGCRNVARVWGPKADQAVRRFVQIQQEAR